jgi:hypothetical protein
MMIIERLVFRARFGQGDTIVKSFRDWQSRLAADFGTPIRILVDVTGPQFTVVVEIEYRDLAHFDELQRREQEMYGGTDFETWFAEWAAVTESGVRELYRVVE